MKEQKVKRVVRVTGCSSGLGLALARRLSQNENLFTVLTARRRSIEKLRDVIPESGRVWIRSLDVTVESEIDRLINEIATELNGVDVLINNAGVCYRSAVEHMDEASELHQLKTNYLGPMSLIRAVVPSMREKGNGQIINVSSVSGMMAMPSMSSYSASKAALESATEALWYELRPFGIGVTAIQPGFIHSNSFKNVLYSGKSSLSCAVLGPYSNTYSAMTAFVERLMRVSYASPDRIASRVERLMNKVDPPLWVPVTFDAQIFALFRNLLPRSLFHKVMYRVLPRRVGRAGASQQTPVVSEN